MMKSFRKDLFAVVSIALILSLSIYGLGFGFKSAQAANANVAYFTDTLSNSTLNYTGNHVIGFTTASTTANTGTFVFTFDASSSQFTVGNVSSSDISMLISQVGTTTYSYNTSCAPNRVILSATSSNSVTLQLCAGSTPMPAGTGVTTTISNNRITNPGSQGSYIIRLNGTAGPTGDTRVAILPNVQMTAAVATTLTFTVSGLGNATSVNSTSTTGTSTATSLAFGTLAPGQIYTLGQQLNVTTNARNGFVVTVQEDQPLTSGIGSTINLFKDGASTTVPIAWVQPGGTLDQTNTYGHYGVTSDDVDLATDTGTSTNDFTGTKYAGDLYHPRIVFAHNGPSDGTTQNKGTAKVAYTMQITPLQPAGNDYANNIWYVATPSF